MIDIHAHVIFDVDDGPADIEESLALIGESYQQGVRTIVATSHRRKGMFETPEAKIGTNFSQLKELAQATYADLELLYGGELYYSHDLLLKLEQGQVPTMNNSRFALIEFSMATPWTDIYTGLSNIIRLGIRPVVAHIERYQALAYQADRVQQLIDMGCYTQINSSHVLKTKIFGDANRLFKKRARYFLDRDLVHCIASDMHNLDARPPYMAQARQRITSLYGTKRAHQLFEDNARQLLANRDL